MASAYYSLVFHASENVNLETFKKTLLALANSRPQAMKLNWRVAAAPGSPAAAEEWFPDSDDYETLRDNWDSLGDEVVHFCVDHSGSPADAEDDRELFLDALAEKGIDDTEVQAQIIMFAGPPKSRPKRERDSDSDTERDAKMAKRV